MALSGYFKDLVDGTSCSDVQLISDNSSSNIFDLVEECCHDSSSHSRRMMFDSSSRSSSSSLVEQQDTRSPSTFDSAYSSPTVTRSTLKVGGGESCYSLDEFRERQRMIRLSMSPGTGVSPTQSPRRRMKTIGGGGLRTKNHKTKSSPSSSSKIGYEADFLRLKAKLDGVSLY